VAHAFQVYTGRIGEWWDPNYSANPASLRAVTIEPRVGGRIFATHEGLGEHDWGEVTAWKPEHRLVHTFTLAQDPDAPSEVSVEFLDRTGGCSLRFAHGGWTEANRGDRAKFNDWPLLLDRFAQLAEAPS
jgi:uncharacterized protein YndB with AHSA1/START domain